MTDELILRTALPGDADGLAELIHRSTNAWYRGKFGYEVFACSPAEVRLFVDTYEALDPGRCLVIEDVQAGVLAGSCFVHPRATHISLGILNVDAAYTGRGIARRLVNAVTQQADAMGLPTRLVSSAMNLDSYSLYSRAGFVPYSFFQDMLIEAPLGLLTVKDPAARHARRCVTPTTHADVPSLTELELACLGIQRPDDLAYFVDHASSGWQVLTARDEAGKVTGYLASIAQPACRIVGPGVSVDEPTMVALLAEQLERRAGETMLVVAPADRPGVVDQLYHWGARNCETHVAQCRPAAGSAIRPSVSGVFLPTFLPETA